MFSAIFIFNTYLYRVKMRTEVPIFKRCCFCIPLRYGLLTWGYLKLAVYILALLEMTFEFIYAIRNKFVHYNGLHITYMVLSSTNGIFMLVGTFLLIIGAHKKSPKILKIVYRCDLVGVGTNGVLFLFSFAHTVMYIVRIFADYGSNFFFLIRYLLLEDLIRFVCIGIQIYFVALVRSEIVKLESKQEFRFMNHAAEAECQYYDNTIHERERQKDLPDAVDKEENC